MRRGYIEVWCTLAVALIVLIFISYNGGLNIGSLKLKSSGIVEKLTKEIDSTAMEQDAVKMAEKPKIVKPVPVDTATQVVLFAGDSMTEGLYQRMAAWCSASGHTMYAVIWYSSTTERWANSKLLKKYIDELHPSFIFFSCGGNELFITDIKDKRTPFVKEIVKEMGNTPFLWIGPPNWKADTGINDMIAENTPEGSFFLTNGMKFNRKKDGAHPTLESSTVWVDSIVRWMPQHSNHPIRLDTPTEKLGHAKHVYVHQPGDEP